LLQAEPLPSETTANDLGRTNISIIKRDGSPEFRGNMKTLSDFIARPEQGPETVKTTVEIDKRLKAKAKAKMKAKKITLRQVVEAALRMIAEEV
jgi:hypothetical protein